MLVIALRMACFFRAKINKNFGHPTLRFGLPTLNALASVLYMKLLFVLAQLGAAVEASK